jgi:hypothetical protein
MLGSSGRERGWREGNGEAKVKGKERVTVEVTLVSVQFMS